MKLSIKLPIKLLIPKYLILFIVGLLACSCSVYKKPDNSDLSQQHKQRILVLNSYSHSFKWTDNIVRAIRDQFKDNPNIVIHIEYMDTKMISNREHFELLKQLYKSKYANYTIDVIISSDDNALKFLREYRKELFPDVPIVLCGVNNITGRKVRGFDNYTGVNERSDHIANFELILKLHPNVKKLYVINDNLTSARSQKTDFFEEIKEYEDKFDVEFLTDFSFQNLMRKVSLLEEDSVVYYLSFFRDNTGHYFTNSEAVRYISQVSPVPVYSSFDTMLGHGIIGGMLVNSYFHGKSTANAAQKILQGVSAKKIPVVLDSARAYMFDHHQLQRFDINLSDLPKGSVIINQP